jgi:hypothetical protein
MVQIWLDLVYLNDADFQQMVDARKMKQPAALSLGGQ